MHILEAVILGTLFGFVLHRIGAANPQNIINMLRLKDLHLMKVILFAIGFSCLFLFLGLHFGLVPKSHIHVKTAYVGVIVGGLIFGSGFAIGGYCPGTSLVALGSLRKDALAFILGGLTGAFLFMLSFGYLKHTFLFNKIAGGKATLADTGIAKYHALITGFPGVAVGVAIGALFMVIAVLLPLSTGNSDN